MKRLVPAFLALHAAFAAEAGSLDFGEANHETVSVSVVSLISNPKPYVGKAIRVIGAGQIEFEGNFICLSKEHLKAYITENCLWMDFNFEALGATPEDLRAINGEHWLIEGEFRSGPAGHLGCCSAAVTNVWRVTEWNLRSE